MSNCPIHEDEALETVERYGLVFEKCFQCEAERVSRLLETWR